MQVIRLTAVARGPTDPEDASSLSAGIWARADPASGLDHVFAKPDGNAVEIVLFLRSGTSESADREARALCVSAIRENARFADWRITP
ncbi:MAG TPA: hypothetical protein VFU73_00320 [Actinocrinis sp.]|nr:hypothetical protein [Actinocrinis sp.]